MEEGSAAGSSAMEGAELAGAEACLVRSWL